MDERLAEAVQRLAAGEDVLSITQSMLPDTDQELLKRAATVRSFDRPLVEAVLAEEITSDETAFDRLITLQFVEPVPASQERWRLREEIRGRYLANWWADAGIEQRPGQIPSELRRLSQRLADWFAGEGASPVEVLYHLLLVDQERARDVFLDHFKEHDDRFELPACQDLVDALGERLLLLDAELVQLRSDRMMYLLARSQWSTEFYQTAFFLEPAGARQRFDELLAGQRYRSLQLWARGGTGKTMQLRWLIARRCVPEPHRIPCARIDFDLIDVVAATRDPWILLLELAQQLNHQLPEAPFHELLEDAGEYTELLRRRPSDAAHQAARRKRRVANQERSQEVVLRFTRTLLEARPHAPIVLVFDTVEEVQLRHAESLRLLLEQLANLQHEVPSVRLVLSGRYDLRGTVPELETLLDGVESVELAPFSPAESRRYLTEVRGIDRQDLIDVVLEKTDGLPFKLALFAEVLSSRPDLTTEELRQYDDPDLLYLIERVLERIPDGQVQWLLRYGVVPRTLDLDFVDEVMRPYLPPAMAGVADYDNPDLDRRPQRHEGKVKVFPTVLASPEQPVDLARLWHELKRYASNSAWVSVVSDGREALSFHPDVKEPMRAILRQQQVFSKLNLRAVDCFQGRAETDRGRWSRWMREVIYHRFQLEGAAAGQHWRRAMAEAVATGRLSWRRDLAAELVGPEYVDELGRPRPRDGGGQTVDWEDLIAAHFHLAFAATRMAEEERAARSHPRWLEAEHELDHALRLEAEHGLSVISPTERTMVQAALLAKDGDLQAAAALLEQELDGVTDDRDRVTLRVRYADVLRALGRPDAVEHYRVALTAVERLDDRVATVDVLRRIALERAGRDRLSEAAAACEEAIERATGASVADTGSLLVLRAELCLRSGEPNRALELLDWPGKGRVAGGAARVMVDALLATGRPLIALRRMREWGVDPPIERQALERELRGAVLTRLLDHSDALRELEAARTMWNEVGDIEGLCRCYGQAIDLHLHGTGNLREAQQLLERATKARPEPGGQAWTAVQLGRAELYDRRGEGRSARQLIIRLLNELADRGAAPHRIVEVAIVGLALRSAHAPEAFLPHLAAVGRIEPYAARLAAVRQLARVPDLSSAQLFWLADLTEVEPFSEAADRELAHLAADDRALLLLGAADLYRVTGQRNKAQTALEEAFETLVSHPEPFILRDLAGVAARVGGRLPLDDRRFLDVYHDHPTLCGATLVEWAGLLGSQQEEAQRLARSGLQLLASDRYPSMWSAKAEELLARTAIDSGRIDDANDHAQRAASIYEQLADARARDRVMSELQPKSEETGVLRDAARVRLRQETPGRLLVSTRVPPAFERVDDLDLLLFDAVASVMGSASLRTSETYEVLDSLAERWQTLGRELGSVAFAEQTVEMLRRYHSRAPIDLHIDMDPYLQPIPWELSLGPDGRLVSAEPAVASLYRILSEKASIQEETRLLQAALNQLLGISLDVDGIVGRRTRAAVVRFQRESGLDPDGIAGRRTKSQVHRDLLEQSAGRKAEVILVRPTALLEEASFRGAQTRGIDAAELYDRAGFSVTVFDAPNLERMHKMLEGKQPTGTAAPVAVHLCAGLVEMESGVYLDFAGSSRGEPVSTTAVDLLMRLYAESPFRPMLILEISRPHSRLEAARHLLLRNSFAAQVFALGGTRAILATGLAGVFQQYPLYESLVEELAQGMPLGSICRRLQSLGGHDADLDGALAFTATALFAHTPFLSVPVRVK